MTEPRCRPFLMSDAMIVIAATAVGFAEARSVLPEMARASFWVVTIVLMISLLPAWSIALAAIRLREPTSSWEPLSREPGWIACMVGGIPSAILQLVCVVLTLAGLPGSSPMYALGMGTLLGSFSVSAVWTTMRIDHGWKPAPGWVDRWGIALGFLWVSILAIPFLGSLIFILYLVSVAFLSCIFS